MNRIRISGFTGVGMSNLFSIAENLTPFLNLAEYLGDTQHFVWNRLADLRNGNVADVTFYLKPGFDYGDARFFSRWIEFGILP